MDSPSTEFKQWRLGNARGTSAGESKCQGFCLDPSVPATHSAAVMNQGKKHPLLPLLVLAALLSACGGGGKAQQPPPNLAPLPPPAPSAGLDPAGGGGAPGGAAAPPRSIKIGEFSVVLVADDAIKNLISVPVHVISTTAETADQLAGEGKAPKYWQSPFKGSNVRALTFGQKGSNSVSVTAPSVAAMDTLLLVVDLAAPAGGNDLRILKIPLKLDYTNPLAPVANPIRVRLTRNGWQRES